MIKIFAILSEKNIRKDIIVFVASVSFDPFKLVCPFSNHDLLVASRKKCYASLSEFIVNRTV